MTNKTTCKDPIEITDTRRKAFYISDNEVVDLAGKFIGPYGCAVYASILRHSDKHGESWPSIDCMAKEWDISRPRVIQSINKLIDQNLISAVKEHGRSSKYKIIDRECWNLHTSKPHLPVDEETSKPHLPVDEETSKPHLPVDEETSKRGLLPPVNVVDPNNTHITIPIFVKTLEQRFNAFWNAWPKVKKRSKGDAEKSWNRIKPSEHLTTIILSAVQRAKTSKDWTKNDGQYIPYPATWLNAKGWEDEYPEESQPKYPEKQQPAFIVGNDGYKRNLVTGAIVGDTFKHVPETPDQIPAAIKEGICGS